MASSDARYGREETGENAPPAEAPATKSLVYRQSGWTRATHWIWVICLFFLLLTGLQIFNAHPALYIGHQSGFGFDNDIFRLGAERTDNGPIGYAEIFGTKFNTTGYLGLFGDSSLTLTQRGFPEWATIPSGRDLATGRVVHFFFAWILLGTLLVWFVASLINGHAGRDVAPRGHDFRGIGKDIAEHAKFSFRHKREYSPLQKLSYAGVLFVLLPLMFITGLGMSPGANSLIPFFPDIIGGRQTARTIHFTVMLLLVAFFVIHILMVLLAGPINEMRSIITGWYRTDAPEEGE